MQQLEQVVEYDLNLNDSLYPSKDMLKPDPDCSRDRCEFTDLSNANISTGNAMYGVDVSFAYNGGYFDDTKWQSKNPVMWDQWDVDSWLHYLADQSPGLLFNAFFGLTGSELRDMAVNDFISRDDQSWETVYTAYHQELARYNQQYSPMMTESFVTDELEAQYENLTSMEKLAHLYLSGNETFASLNLPSIATFRTSEPTPKVEPDTEVKAELETPPPSPTSSEASSTVSHKSTGKKTGRVKGKLWEFIRDLLLNPETNPSIIKWEDHEKGVFRIVKSDKVAGLWGKRKANPSMTYEKMSRAMRYYYKKHILERIDGRRLVYKFGSTSKGWQL